MKRLFKYAAGAVLVFVPFIGFSQNTDNPPPSSESVFKNSSIDINRGRKNRPGTNHVAKIGFGGLIGMPISEFKDVAGDVTPWGYGINAAFRISRNSPLFAGLDFGYMGMGRNVDVFTAINGTTSRIARRNRIITGHALLRLQPNIGGPVRPYFDGMFGLKYFRTATEIENNWNNWWNNNNNRNSNIITVPNHEDVALSYGGGIGLNIVLGENVWLDLRTVYLPGTVASYVKRGDVYPDPNDPARTIVIKSRSATDMLNHQVGITFSF